MKFRCERDSLVEVLTTAGRAVGSRTSTSMALGGVRIETSGNHLAVVGTDLDLTIHVSTEAIGISDGVCVAPAKLLADIVRSLEPGAVTIEAEAEKVEIGAARSRFSLRTFPVDDFPTLPEPPQPATFLPAAGLASALRQVVRAASNDDARPLLTGVLVAAEGNDVRLVATDSYRLAMRDIDGSDALAGASQILVPARALAELQKLSVLGMPTKDSASGSTGEGADDGDGVLPTIGLSIGDHDVTFTAGDVKVSTRLLDGSYPDYRQLIPSEYPNRLHVGKDSLLDALRRVRLLVRDNTTPVRLSMRPGGVELTVVSQEVGDASETVDADFDGTELTIAFNPTYLIDGVEAVTGDEVLLETVDATKPATVRAAEETSFRYLLMPVRVS
ncbi:MAG TPA: DNA polymerase III subunit beta [Acidimicrobiales bacterium]|nr:DNA polymerase III subunit beta [Acidimicrobiales bacterium]